MRHKTIGPFDWTFRSISMNIMSEHALQRMAERKIDLDLVRRCLIEGYYYPDDAGHAAYCLPMVDRELRVIVDGSGMIVTVYFAALTL